MKSKDINLIIENQRKQNFFVHGIVRKIDKDNILCINGENKKEFNIDLIFFDSYLVNFKIGDIIRIYCNENDWCNDYNKKCLTPNKINIIIKIGNINELGKETFDTWINKTRGLI